MGKVLWVALYIWYEQLPEASEFGKCCKLTTQQKLNIVSNVCKNVYHKTVQFFLHNKWIKQMNTLNRKYTTMFVSVQSMNAYKYLFKEMLLIIWQILCIGPTLAYFFVTNSWKRMLKYIETCTCNKHPGVC